MRRICEEPRNLYKKPILKGILISWADFIKGVKLEEIKYVLSSPLWFNTHLRNNLYANNWDSKRLKTIGDILDNNGNFYTF